MLQTLVAVALLAIARAQTIQTVNGSMVLQIPGATLTFAATSSSAAAATPSNVFASVADVVAAQTLAAQAQPQVREAFFLASGFE
jgi:4-amino-4-deoxy-L-arabinose transferase-like glycosyltransferase